MDNTQEEQEEHAYQRGWRAYFDIGTGAKNPYCDKSEKLLFSNWRSGQINAESLDKFITKT